MYYCLNCEQETENLQIISEKHGLDTPPYEEFYVCPFCKSEEVIKEIRCAKCDEIITDDFIAIDDKQYCRDCFEYHAFEELYNE